MSQYIKDSLRHAVEIASGGKQTVIYSVTGKANVVNIIEKFLLSDIDPSLPATPHPAFIIDGETKDSIGIGTYPGTIVGGEMVSQPALAPTTNMKVAELAAAAAAAGNGLHAITSVEWNALAALAYRDRVWPSGNSNWGLSWEAPYTHGVRVDGYPPGTTTGPASPGWTFGGSGPTAWRHDRTPYGIADVVGNVATVTVGARLVGGEVQIIPNNDAAKPGADVSDTSSLWRAINGATGELVVPTYTGTIGADNFVVTTENSVRVSRTGTEAYSIKTGANGSAFSETSNVGATPISDAALAILKGAGLFPYGVESGPGTWWYSDSAASVANLARGGNYQAPQVSGLNWLVSVGPVSVFPYVGARLAAVL